MYRMTTVPQGRAVSRALLPRNSGEKLLQAGNQRRLSIATANFDIGYHNTYTTPTVRGFIGIEVPFFNTENLPDGLTAGLMCKPHLCLGAVFQSIFSVD